MARFILSSASLYHYPLELFFELAAEAGFAGVEIMVNKQQSTQDPAMLQRLSDKHGIRVLCGGMIVQSDPQLLEVVAAMETPGRFPGSLDGGQQQRHQNADDGNHHE